MEQLICENISKNYKSKDALQDVSLTLEKGKIYGLIGRNGAGKTTLLSILSAQNPPSGGRVVLETEGESLPVWENEKALSHKDKGLSADGFCVSAVLGSADGR